MKRSGQPPSSPGRSVTSSPQAKPALGTPSKNGGSATAPNGAPGTAADGSVAAPEASASTKRNHRSSEDEAIHVRRIHRRDLPKTWEFLKLCFRDVNRDTVEYQRPRSKKRFFEVYEEEGIVQLLFELKKGKASTIVGYAECAFDISGTDNWMNHRYFAKRDMKPLFVEEIAVHPGHQGLGIGSFVLEQMEHIAKLAGCTHLVLEVAENNENALRFYRARNFQKLDAAIFLAKRVAFESDILPPRPVRKSSEGSLARQAAKRAKTPAKRVTRPSRPPRKPKS